MKKTMKNDKNIFIYLFFLVHMWAFWTACFYISYFQSIDFEFLIPFASISISIYLLFYFVIFWTWKVKDMFVNAIVGCLWIYAWLWDILSFFGENINSFHIYVHIVPWIYFVMYTFLLRNLLKDIFSFLVKKDGEKIWDYVFYWFGWISLIFSFI